MKNSKQSQNTPVISREVYKAIKTYDRQRMERFCTDLYMRGYNDGRESIPGVDVDKVIDAIAAIPGIGPKRLSDIKASIDSVYEK